MSKELIVKNNELIEAGYNLTLQEQKLILKLISIIGKEDTEFTKVMLPMKELAEEFGVTTGSFYTDMKKIIRGFLDKTIQLKTLNGIRNINWLSYANYINDKGLIELKLNNQLKPYLLQLEDNFTKYKINNILSLKNTYSIRLYELLKQYEKLKERVITVEDLRFVLGMEDNKYKLYADFKKRVLEVALNEINKKTDICIEIEEKKEARKVTSIKFCIRTNEKPKLDTTVISNPIIEEPITEIKEYDSIIETLYKKIKVSERVVILKDYLKTTLETKSYETVESNIAYSNTNARSNYIAFLKRAIEEDYAVDTRLKVKSLKPTIVPTTSEVEVVEGGLPELQLLELIKQIPVEEYDKLKSEYDRNKFIPKSIVSLERYIVANRLS